MRKAAMMAVISAGLCFLPGCGTRMAATQESWRANAEVVSPYTPLWTAHPVSEFTTPVALLIPGDEVRLLKNHLGFSKVQLSNLQTGWVARGTVFRR